MEKVDKNWNFIFLTQNRGWLVVFDVQFLKILRENPKFFLIRTFKRLKGTKSRNFSSFGPTSKEPQRFSCDPGLPGPPPVPDRVKGRKRPGGKFSSSKCPRPAVVGLRRWVYQILNSFWSRSPSGGARIHPRSGCFLVTYNCRLFFFLNLLNLFNFLLRI